MKTKQKNRNKFFKFLLVLKKFWYIVLISGICFSALGYFVGQKRSENDITFSRETKYYILKTNIIISSANYQDFSETFNNSCLYFMKEESLIKDTIRTVNDDISNSEAVKLIKISGINTLSNMVNIEIKYTSKEDSKLILEKYIEKATFYLNKTLKNNVNSEGIFKDGVEASDKILLSQIGDITYLEHQETISKKVTNVVRYVIVGLMLGVVAGVSIIFLARFYFNVHDPIDVVKNFGIDYIGTIESEKTLFDYISSNRNLIFCGNEKNKIITSKNYFTKEEICNSNIFEFGEEKNIVILVKEDKDTFFYIEKLQLLLKNKIRGFVLYK